MSDITVDEDDPLALLNAENRELLRKLGDGVSPLAMLKLRLDVLTDFIVHPAVRQQFEYMYEHALNQALHAAVQAASTPQLLVPEEARRGGLTIIDGGA